MLFICCEKDVFRHWCHTNPMPVYFTMHFLWGKLEIDQFNLQSSAAITVALGKEVGYTQRHFGGGLFWSPVLWNAWKDGSCHVSSKALWPPGLSALHWHPVSLHPQVSRGWGTWWIPTGFSVALPLSVGCSIWLLLLLVTPHPLPLPTVMIYCKTVTSMLPGERSLFSTSACANYSCHNWSFKHLLCTKKGEGELPSSVRGTYSPVISSTIYIISGSLEPRTTCNIWIGTVLCTSPFPSDFKVF